MFKYSRAIELEVIMFYCVFEVRDNVVLCSSSFLRYEVLYFSQVKWRGVYNIEDAQNRTRRNAPVTSLRLVLRIVFIILSADCLSLMQGKAAYSNLNRMRDLCICLREV